MRRIAPVKKRRPDQIKKLFLCETIIAPLEEHIRITGLEHREEAALIVGYITLDSIGVGTTVLLPHTENTSASCVLPMDITIKCVEAMDQAGQIILAQVHSHPGQLCGHSSTDDHWAFSDSPGLFSIVVPCFGRFGIRAILEDGVAIYERLRSGEWDRLSPSETQQRLAVVPNHRAVT